MTLMLLFLSLISCLGDNQKPGTWEPFYVVLIGQPLGRKPDREQQSITWKDREMQSGPQGLHWNPEPK